MKCIHFAEVIFPLVEHIKFQILRYQWYFEVEIKLHEYFLFHLKQLLVSVRIFSQEN